MLIKRLFHSGDFETTLRRRRLFAFGMLAIGLTGVVCFFLFVNDNPALHSFVQGFYMGGASGISAGAAVLLIRTTYLLGHPEEAKKAKIKETDEREKQIVNDSFRLAGTVTFFTSAAALFVILPFSIPAVLALLGSMVLYCATFVVSNLILSKRM